MYALCVRFGLYDQRRTGETVVPSPDGRLVATTDSFGRIILIDTRNGVAVRMWKGNSVVSLTDDQSLLLFRCH